MKTRKEFISDLINCKDIKELFKCLSSAGAHMNYEICLVKRDDTQEGFNEYYSKEIMLRDFLFFFLSANEGLFMYENNIKYLIDLIRITNNYLVNKYEKTLNTAFQKTPHKQSLNNTKKYQNRVKKHLELAKKDLQEIQPQGGKTKSLLNSIATFSRSLLFLFSIYFFVCITILS